MEVDYVYLDLCGFISDIFITIFMLDCVWLHMLVSFNQDGASWCVFAWHMLTV